jgi:hypothetical protein
LRENCRRRDLWIKWKEHFNRFDVSNTPTLPGHGHDELARRLMNGPMKFGIGGNG